MYPINLNVENKLCVMIGGGRAGVIKGRKLINAGAKLMVISPFLCEEMKKLPIHYLCAYYDKELLPEDAFIVVCATDNPALNKKIADDAKENKSLVLNAQSPKCSDFSVMTHQETDNWGIALSTKGKAPGFAPHLCRIIGQQIEPYNKVIAYLEQVRRQTENAEELRHLMGLFTSEHSLNILKTQGTDRYYQLIQSIYNGYMGKDVEAP